MNHTSQSDISPSAFDPMGTSFVAAPGGISPDQLATGHLATDDVATGDVATGDLTSGDTVARGLGAEGFMSDRDLDTFGKRGNAMMPGSAAEVDSIEFRVLRAGAPVRRLRLTGNRYTFGSADGCSIRLDDNTLRPMHAVLIRDAQRILVRAYSVPVEINGQPTTEKTLNLGDILRIGAYRFELLSASSRSSTLPPAVTYDSGVGSSPSVLSSTPVTGGIPNQEDVVWRERLRREVEQWRARQTECEQRESRCDDREANLRGRESELWARAEHLYRREAQLQAQESAAIQIHEEYAEKQQELIRVRQESHAKQREFERRESEFRTLQNQYHRQEIAYRNQVEEATRQLQQSQRQAATATDAVQRMREQFVSLNRQIDELSSQQDRIQREDEGQREEHLRLLKDLELSRDAAIDSRAESDAKRHEAERQVDEISAQLEALRAERSDEVTQHQARLAESEAVATQLRQQVEALQQSVDEARQESEQLRADYEQACQSVHNLETLVSQSNEKGNQDRESWILEADQLRQSVEQLSVELAQANGELSDLREANQSLSSRLEEMRSERDQVRDERDQISTERDQISSERDQISTERDQISSERDEISRQRDEVSLERDQISQQRDQISEERDQIRAEIESRPTTEAWQSLREELDRANDQLASMKQEYDQTIADLESARAAEEARVIEQARIIEQISAERAAAVNDASGEDELSGDPAEPSQDGDADGKSEAGSLLPLAGAAAAAVIGGLMGANRPDEADQEAGVSEAASATDERDGGDTRAANANSESIVIEPSEWESETEASALDGVEHGTESEAVENETPLQHTAAWQGNPNAQETTQGEELAAQETDHPWPGYTSSESGEASDSESASLGNGETEASVPSVEHTAVWETAPDGPSDSQTAENTWSHDPASADVSSDGQESAGEQPESSVEHTAQWRGTPVDNAGDEQEPQDPWANQHASETSESLEAADTDTSSEPDPTVEPTSTWGQTTDINERGSEETGASWSDDESALANDSADTSELDDTSNTSDLDGSDSVAESAIEHTASWDGTPEVDADAESDDHPSHVWGSAAEAESASSPDQTWSNQPESSVWDAHSSNDSQEESAEPSSDWSASQDEPSWPSSEAAQQAGEYGGGVDESGVTSPWTPVEQLDSDEDGSWDSAGSFESESAALEPESGDGEPGDEEGGSLARMLIQDLESDSVNEAPAEGTFVMDDHQDTGDHQDMGGTWDSEHPEEARASSWTNESDGYRSESIEEDDPYSDTPADSYGYESDDEQDSAEESLVSDYQSEMEDSPEPTSAPEPVADTNDFVEDDSIEAYMNRLLQRVQGDDDTQKPETVALSASLPMESTPEQASAGDTVSTETVRSEDAPIDRDAPMVPRSEAPEKHSNLSAMRELANESARNAISRSVRVQSRDIQIKAFIKFFFAAVALACGGACWLFIPGAMRWLAVAMTLVVAGVCVAEGMQLLGEAKKRFSAAGGDEGDFELDEDIETSEPAKGGADA